MQKMQYDIIVLGGGPGGYTAAIRASQLGFRTAVVEKDRLGGVCLNCGCIPTKTLIKSAQVFENIKHAAEYGITAGDAVPDIGKIVERAKNVAAAMNKGVEFLFKKNKIDLFRGTGRIKAAGVVEVSGDGAVELCAPHLIVATGARPKELPALPLDEKHVVSYRTALFPARIPATMTIVGSGAIGVELAYFYSSIGVKVTLAEFMPEIVPLEDDEVGAQLNRSLRKAGIKTLTDARVDAVSVGDDGNCTVSLTTKKGQETLICEQVLSAAGVVANIENLGLEDVGVATAKGKIVTDGQYRTSVAGIYAVGDVIATPALAHVASAEAVRCVENIAGIAVEPVDYDSIPSCIYTTPEIASVGMTERAARAAGYEVCVGKFPFSASGKALSAGNRDGFVKLVFDGAVKRLLGAHLIGMGVTEIIGGLALARKNGFTARQIVQSVQPHPTMSEAVGEAAAAALGEVIHL
jgi:dihydrolipoamide dehydrogenase